MYDMYRPGYSYESKRCHVKSDLKIHFTLGHPPLSILQVNSECLMASGDFLAPNLMS